MFYNFLLAWTMAKHGEKIDEEMNVNLLVLEVVE
jgi:hypothetical protein